MSERMIRTLHQGIDEVPPGRRSVALGTFDGVHLGHRAVIAAAHATGLRLGVSTMAATFHPRPATVIRPGTPPASLSGITERIRMLYQAGADEVVMMRFTPELARLTAVEFVQQVLVDRFGAVAITVGEDFRFGHDRLGGVEAMLAGEAVEGVHHAARLVVGCREHFVDDHPAADGVAHDDIREGAADVDAEQ